MNFNEARSLAISGHRVRAIDMQPGAFVYYDFAGLRIDVGGNSSGWSPKPHDEEVEWEDIPYVEVDPMDIPNYRAMFPKPGSALYEHQSAWRGNRGVVIVDGTNEPPLKLKDFGLKVGDVIEWTPGLGKAVAAVQEVVKQAEGLSKWGARPDPAPANVGKWGAPKRDAWGRKID